MYEFSGKCINGIFLKKIPIPEGNRSIDCTINSWVMDFGSVFLMFEANEGKNVNIVELIIA